MQVLHYPLLFLLRQGSRQEIITQILRHSTLVGIQLMVFKNQMTAAQVKVMRKIMLTYGGMDYGTICIVVLNFHS